MQQQEMQILHLRRQLEQAHGIQQSQQQIISDLTNQIQSCAGDRKQLEAQKLRHQEEIEKLCSVLE